MVMDKINEFKVEKIEKQSKLIGMSEMNELMDYVYCGIEVGMALACLSPLFAAAALGYFITAQMERKCGSELKEDLEEIKSIRDEADFEEYKIERIEICEKEIKKRKVSKITYGIVSALALGGMFLAPAVCLVPLYIGLYGFLNSSNRVAKTDLEKLSAMDYDRNDYEEDYEKSQSTTNNEPEKVKTYTNSSDTAYAY